MEATGNYTIDEADIETPVDAFRPADNAQADEWREYAESIEKRVAELKSALEAKPGAEARGIAWCDVYGKKVLPDNRYQTIKISVTARSDVDALDAFEQLVVAVKHASRRGFRPYNA